ncbi:DUF5677 domain-containing protein [Pseudomonas sp.]|jgi:hypothetical protein|uniref:DUF5677 domain-containing protein n=1 Tax=Pseudomonas sp. TaxID=306 RepID=UPI0037CB9963
MAMHEEMSAFDRLLEGLLLAIEGQAAQPSTGEGDNRQLLRCLILKLWKGLSTLRAIHEPRRVVVHGQGTFSFVDFSSVAVLARSALENHLIIEWLFGSHSSEEIKQFRRQLWIYGGYMSRASHKPTMEPAIEMCKQAYQQAQDMRPEIIRGLETFYPAVFKDAKKKRKFVLDGHWTKVFSYQSLATDAGHHPDYFATLYASLSGHAHTNYNSVFQTATLSGLDQQLDLAKTFTILLLPMMAHTLLLYENLVPGARQALSKSPELVDLAQEYRIEKDDMVETFKDAWRYPETDNA